MRGKAERDRAWGLPLLLALSTLWISPRAVGQIYKLPNPDESPGDFFGVSVGIDGARAIVGASGSDACGVDAGAAYVYEADSTTGHWNHVATLVPDDCTAGDYFGRSLDLSGDRAIIAAFRPTELGLRPNAAYVFERETSGAWAQRARFEVSPFGTQEGAFAAAVSLDGDTAIVTTSGDVVHGRYHGAAYVYRRGQDGGWAMKQRLSATSDMGTGVLGTSVDLDGDVAVVGASTYLANKPGSIHIFRLEPATDIFVETGRFGDIDDFFLPVCISDGRIIVGERRYGVDNAGRATIFERSGGGWHRSANLRPVNPFAFGAFGSAVALGPEWALVVGYDEQLQFEFNIDSVVYVFERLENGRWRQRHIIDVGEVSFGSGIDMDGNVALIGQSSDDQPGAAYVVQVH